MNRKYSSVTTGEPCTAAQLIAEKMVQRKASSDGKTLPYKFWNTPTWKLEYTRQVLAANSLLKVYDAQAILNTLKNKNLSWVYSLRTKPLTDAIRVEQGRLDRQKVVALEESKIKVIENTEFTPKKKFGKKGKIGRLE